MKKIFIDPENIDSSLIEEAAGVLSKGGIVAFPTETVYGLGCRADKKDVVEKLYELKQRPKDKPFSLAIGDIPRVFNNYFDTLPPFGYRLIERFWPGPLTIIYYSPTDKKVGVRVPSNVIASQILQALSTAVYLPSANISGQKEAVTASEVETSFGDKIDLIVEGECCSHSRPSTVVDLTFKPFKMLREGVISERDILKVFIRKRILFVCTGNSCRSPMAEFLMRKYLKQVRPYFNDRYEIISRGIAAFPGTGATAPVINILKKEESLDASRFFAQRLDKRAILSSDLIFTMEENQSKHILRYEPKAEGKVFNLKKFLPPEFAQDIPDPIGRGMKAYEQAYSLIKEAVLELRDWL